MQSDRKDKSAHGWEHHEKVDKHESQKGGFTFVLCAFHLFIILYFPYFCPDYKTGFGGDYGVQTDRVDKSAVGWEHHEQVDKHESQKGKIATNQNQHTDNPFHPYSSFMVSFQITKLDLEVNMGFRRTELIRVLWAGTTGSR